jgi:hypothetical protein
MHQQEGSQPRSKYAYILEGITFFLLAFIPLYPKLPLLDVAFTWTYIRLEDVLVGVAFLVLGFGVLTNKVYIKNFLFWPIVVFWTIGFISTLWAANMVGLADNWAVFKPHLIFIHYLRRIEYLGVFFLAYAAMQSG